LGQSISLDEIALIYRYQSNYDQALAYNLKALKINRELGNKIQIANSLTYIGNNYMHLANYEESLKYHLEALKIYEEIGGKDLIAFSLNNVGGIYFNLKKYDMALEYFLKSLELKKAAGNKKSIASTLNNIGSTYHMLGNYRQALESSQQSLEIYEEMGDKYGRAICLSSIGSAYFQLKEYQKGLEYQLKSLEIRKAIGNKEGAAVCLDNIGQFYKETGKYDKAFYYFEQSLSLAKEIKAKDLMRDIYDRISKTYSEQGNYQKALEYYQLHSAVKDEILNKESNDKIAELQTKYETEKKEKQIEILQKSSEIQRLNLSRERFKSNAFIVGFVLVLIILLLLFKKYIFLLAFWKKRNYIGHYKIINEIDSGGMGIVYRANHLLDKSKLVAIKVMKEESSKDIVQRQRFLNEALIIDQLHHPNIVKVIERGEYNNRLFIAMELLEGKPLSYLIKAGLKLSIKEAAAIMDQLFDAVFKIHSKGIIHRDLKPDNIMLIDKEKESKNFVKILDFGLAKNRSLTQLTETGEILGTINYLPPERISNQEFSNAGDIYSLGIIFYEMMTLEKPFLGELQVDVIRSILEKEPIEPGRFNPDIPAQLNELIMKMMDKDPIKRPSEKVLKQTVAQYL
jgi:tetratricopeptide (TPR) repeat protein